MIQFNWISTPDGPTPDELYNWMVTVTVGRIPGLDAINSAYWQLTQESQFQDIWNHTYWTNWQNHGILSAIYGTD